MWHFYNWLVTYWCRCLVINQWTIFQIWVRGWIKSCVTGNLLKELLTDRKRSYYCFTSWTVSLAGGVLHYVYGASVIYARSSLPCPRDPDVDEIFSINTSMLFIKLVLHVKFPFILNRGHFCKCHFVRTSHRFWDMINKFKICPLGTL